jgi:hypothetical protein
MTDVAKKKPQLSVFLSALASLEVKNGFLLISYTTRGSDSYKIADYDGIHFVNDIDLDHVVYSCITDMVE